MQVFAWRATFEKRADNDESACFRWTVKFFALDGKTGRRLFTFGCGEGEFDNTCFGVFAIYRDLSRSSGPLQRCI